MSELKKMLEGVNVSDNLYRFLSAVDEERGIGKLKVIDPEFAIAKTSRSEWGSSGGIGYYDQVRVYYHGQASMQEWQWRDRWSASNDRHDLCVNDIGEVNVEEAGDEKVKVLVELVNNKYRNRTATYVFKKAAAPVIPLLNDEEQKSFSQKVASSRDKLLSESILLWRLKPQMLADYSGIAVIPTGSPTYVYYREPVIKQEVIRPEWGVAAFILQEQIDHRGSDPQYRYELYLVKPADCRQIYEDHAYEKGEGSALISIVDLQPDRIEINTRGGKRTIKFS